MQGGELLLQLRFRLHRILGILLGFPPGRRRRVVGIVRRQNLLLVVRQTFALRRLRYDVFHRHACILQGVLRVPERRASVRAGLSACVQRGGCESTLPGADRFGAAAGGTPSARS